jgi:predicted Zn-dependent protease
MMLPSEISQRVLSYGSVAGLRVRVRSSATGNSRLADSMPTTTGDIERIEVSVTATGDGGGQATLSSNQVDDAELRALVRRTEALANMAPRDAEATPMLGPTDYVQVDAVDPAVAAMGPRARGELAHTIITNGQAEGLVVSGYVEHRDAIIAVADRAGLAAAHRDTRVRVAATCRTPDGTGSSKAGAISHQIGDIDGAKLARDTAKWALRSRAPRAIAPGKMCVVLGQQAVADLLSLLLPALDHRHATQGRTFFSAPDGSTKLGEKLFGPRIHLWSDPADTADPACPIADDGRPDRRVDWVVGGVLRSLTASAFWSMRAGVASRPEPSSLRMDGDEATLDELVAGVDRGLLVTRFWYNDIVSQRQLLATGVTRDGTFLIERGKIVAPVLNMRYNDSPLTLLERTTVLGKPVRAGLSEKLVVVVPPLVVDGFKFTSVSPAI